VIEGVLILADLALLRPPSICRTLLETTLEEEKQIDEGFKVGQVDNIRGCRELTFYLLECRELEFGWTRRARGASLLPFL
jgi:hypothetical protein